MSRAARWVLIAAVASGLPLGQAALANDANFLYGHKLLGEDYLDRAGVDGHTEMGVALTLDFGWPVALAVDLLSSSDDNSNEVVTGPDDWRTYTTETSTMELDVGVRKIWDGKIEPFVGGGIALIKLDATQTETDYLLGEEYTDRFLDDDDIGVGLWIGAGFVYRVGPSFNVGLDVRYSNSSADLTPAGFTDSLKLDSGGTHYAIMLGYHW